MSKGKVVSRKVAEREQLETGPAKLVQHIDRELDKLIDRLLDLDEKTRLPRGSGFTPAQVADALRRCIARTEGDDGN